jgi:hypothetical protein
MFGDFMTVFGALDAFGGKMKNKLIQFKIQFKIHFKKYNIKYNIKYNTI